MARVRRDAKGLGFLTAAKLCTVPLSFSCLTIKTGTGLKEPEIKKKKDKQIKITENENSRRGFG